MSSLIFFTTPERALVATDTLTVSPDDNSPFSYSTKAFILPHLRLLICGTGLINFLNNWIVKVNDFCGVRAHDGLDDWLNDFTERYLYNCLIEWDDKFPGAFPDTTIYHFGFFHDDSPLKSYAYRSTANFRSEKLIYGTGTKPPVPLEKHFSWPDDLRQIMEMQRVQELKKPLGERVCIGGEILLYILTPEVFQVSIHDRFNDYEHNRKRICDRHIGRSGMFF